MFLSRVEINPYRRETMRALASPQKIHAVVEASFPPIENAVSERILWRIDTIGSAMYILVQSSIRPDFTHLVEQFGWPSSEQKWDTVDMDNFLRSIKKGQIWRFRLRANPVRSLKDPGDRSRGKISAHVTVEQQREWLLSRVHKYGFSVISFFGDHCVEVKQRDQNKFERKGDIVTVNAVTFEGVLAVEDEKLFTETIIKGIGRAKAYGCGLITVVSVR